MLLNTCKIKFNPVKGISGMKSDIKPGEKDSYLNPTISDIYIDNLTLCDPDDKTCNNYKEGVDESAKKKNTENVRKFVSETDDFIMMIYAPWCGHCDMLFQNSTKLLRNLR